MANVFDVAEYILEERGQMSTWKLQKLCFYSQAWCLAWEGHELFPEEFEAWRNGPVCRELFEAHRGKYLISAGELHFGDPTMLSQDEKEMIDIVLRDYGDMQPFELREQTHSEFPWLKARHGLPENANCSEIISKNDIGEYYGSL